MQLVVLTPSDLATPPLQPATPLPLPCRVVGNGVLVMSIDHLPAQLPREATDYFGTQLLPFVKELVSHYTLPSMHMYS